MLRFALRRWLAALAAAVRSGRLGALVAAEATQQHFNTDSGDWPGL